MKKVLVIDDHPGVRATICSIVRHGGYEAIEAANGLEGLTIFERGGFSLVVTDLMMPGQNGADTIRRLRVLDPHVPIIAVSAFGWDEGEAPLKDAAEVGANRTFGKPFEAEELIAAMRELVRD